jgi:3-isopropylmalate/(R)-2-methylmalate dehydratase small subunit
MEPFKSHRGKIALLDRANVDTDQIIPKQFLKSVKKTGFGEHLFFDWRYLPDGNPNPDFSLNQPQFQGASILVARNNFGCGSSREHAVWAIQQDGYKVVIAPKKGSGDIGIPAFADIFRSNAGNNGLLTVELTEEEVDQIFQATQETEGLEATANLGDQKITLHLSKELIFNFEIDAAVKDHLINGLDPIELTLKQEAKIRSFEAKHNNQLCA